ncbi:MAG TPA: hypothetical protein VGI00_21100 [Streptosporangiaceae bacterium]|jgi:hypothetical protein
MTTRPPGPVTTERDQVWPVIWVERLRLAALPHAPGAGAAQLAAALTSLDGPKT